MYLNRIKEHRRVKASTIRPHPENWRLHPEEQAAALEGVLGEVGIARSVLAYDDSEWGLTLIDGHLRRDKLGDQEIDVEVLDVTREEAKKILLTMDSLGAMAETDQEAVRKLLAEIDTESEALMGLLAKMIDAPEIPIDLPTIGESNPKEHVCPKCGCHFTV